MPSDSIEFGRRQILFRNFAGKEGQFNREGDRNFCLPLSPEEAEQMATDGWNVKYLKPRDPDEERQAYLAVSVSSKYKPARVIMLTSRGRTTLPEDMFFMVDWVDIDWTEMIIRPYVWAVSGKTGVKAYLQSIVVRVLEDALELRYADVPEVGMHEQALALEGSDPNVIEYDGPVVVTDRRELGR